MKGVEEVTRKAYSEALKLHVVSEIENGKQSLAEACRRYGIPVTTARDWLDLHGKRQRRVRVIEVTMKDQEDKIKELKSALSDAHLKIRIYEKMFELAEKECGIGIKKNTATGQLELVRTKKVVRSQGAAK